MAAQHIVEGTVVKERHPLGPLGLGLVTLGVYGLVWYYKVNKELRAVTGEGNPGVSLLAITLGAFLVVPPFVSWFNTAERIRVAQDRAGVTSQINPVLALVLLLLPFVNVFATAYLQFHLNAAWQRAAGRPPAALPSTQATVPTAGGQPVAPRAAQPGATPAG